jgi:hypothetical protein
MHANRILLYPLIVASVAVDLVFLDLAQGSYWPDTLVAVLLGLAGGQINLATLWGVLGYRHLPWRVAGLIVVPIAWSFAVFGYAPEMLPGYQAVVTWVVHFLTHTALLASILFLVRLFGARLIHGDLLPQDAAGNPLQFTLRYMLAWITATAIVLSALKTTFEHTTIAETRFPWDAILILGFVNAMLGLASVWIFLDTRQQSRRRVASLVTLLPTVCVVVCLSFLAEPDRLLAVLLLWLVVGSYSAIALIVLHTAGLRLAWPGKSDAKSSSLS